MPATIAIDGPSASGKSTVGSLLAQRLGYDFLDTGVMYRAVAWLAHEREVDPNDAVALESLIRDAKFAVFPAEREGDETRVLVNDKDVTSSLREAAVEQTVSLVSRVPAVRTAMVRLQRKLARNGRIVMVGRDIGTIVLPDAELKVYLNASLAERARRRYEQVSPAGRHAGVRQVESDLAQRDRIDSQRAASPLRPAVDAVIINTDHLSLDEVVGSILNLISEQP